jgi:hypothetical protein
MRLFRNKQEDKLKAQIMDKLREEELDRVILNPKFNSDELRARMEKPVNVEYLSEASSGERSRMIHITEMGVLATKEYILNPRDPISVGTGNDNTIVLSDLSVGDLKCEIMVHNGILAAKSNDHEKKVVLKRNKKSTYLMNELIEIRSLDEILLGKTTIRIRIL